ncbi:DUF1003 domain-containing protein [Nocardioides baekrokdamisoli]|nr:hypothetical protein [Nocardioides baekrokdamisoli]
MTDFAYTQHPHVEARKAAGPPTRAKATETIHGDSKVGRVNAKIGLRITMIVGTMWAAYAFFALSVVSLPSALQSHSAIVIVAWIAQTFLQLVLLPIILVGQNLQAASSDARAQATYDDASAVLEEAKQIQAHLLVQDEAIKSILTHLNGIGGSKS